MYSPDTVIYIALNEVGYVEKSLKAFSDNKNCIYDKSRYAGNDNVTKYGFEMHNLYPSVMDFPAAWCDSFVDWCFKEAYGVSTARSLLGGNFDDYTVASAQMYKNKNSWFLKNPVPGDQIFFTNGKRICHTGIVYNVDKKFIYTVEGNTSSGSKLTSTLISNGGCVAKKQYTINYLKIAGYGRPKYDVPATTKLGDRNANVVKLQQRLISKGYPLPKYGADGDFGQETLNAVKEFQNDIKYTTTGVVDANTWFRLV